jgi:hypothetical protein
MIHGKMDGKARSLLAEDRVRPGLPCKIKTAGRDGKAAPIICAEINITKPQVSTAHVEERWGGMSARA